MSSTLDIVKVDRYKAEWDPKTIFMGFKVRAVLKHTDCAITNINHQSQLKRRLQREVGVEGEDWLLQTNGRTNESELYLVNSGKLIMWKLQDHEKFSTLFERIEQHKDNLDEVRED